MEQFFKAFAEAVSPALQVLLQSLLVMLAGQLSGWLYRKYQMATTSLSQEQHYMLDIFVTAAVKAAEQLYSDGREKREYAFATVEKYLAQAGLAIDADVIFAQIEAEVYNQFTKEPAEFALG